jgi:undecaprenol kinase
MIRIERLIKSFVYALRGLSKTYREEQNLRVQTAVGTVMVALALIFRINRLEWCLLLLTIGLVILMEIANSAVERITDVLKPRINGYVKEIKDIAAAAVMLSSLISVIIGVIIFWPYLFDAWRNLDI